MLDQEKLILGIITSPNNLDGWDLKDSGVLRRQDYNIVTGIDTYTIIDPKGDVTSGDALHPLFTAVNKVNDILKPNIEFEYQGTRFDLVPLDFKKIEPLMNKDVTVYNKGIIIGTINMGCDDVPTGVSVSDMDNPILCALKVYLNEWLDD